MAVSTVQATYHRIVASKMLQPGPAATYTVQINQSNHTVFFQSPGWNLCFAPYSTQMRPDAPVIRLQMRHDVPMEQWPCAIYGNNMHPVTEKELICYTLGLWHVFCEIGALDVTIEEFYSKVLPKLKALF